MTVATAPDRHGKIKNLGGCVYLTVLMAVALPAVVWMVHGSIGARSVLPWEALAVLVALVVVVEGSIFPTRTSRYTLGGPFYCALIALAPVGVAVLACSLPSFAYTRSKAPMRSVFFNVAQAVLMVAAGRWVFCSLTGTGFFSPAGERGTPFYLAVAACGVVMVCLSEFLVEIMNVLHDRVSEFFRPRALLVLESILGPVAVAAALASPLVVVLLWLSVFMFQRQIVLAEEREHLATHDGLTGLPNRARLRERLTSAAAGKYGALMLVDLDGFKGINDRFGHATGDALLCEVGQRLEASLLAGDLAARWGGDEFVLVIVQDTGRPSPMKRAEDIIEALSASYAIVEDDSRIGASVGIALVGDRMMDPDKVFAEADTALYAAKSSRGSWAVFNSDLAVSA